MGNGGLRNTHPLPGDEKLNERRSLLRRKSTGSQLSQILQIASLTKYYARQLQFFKLTPTIFCSCIALFGKLCREFYFQTAEHINPLLI